MAEPPNALTELLWGKPPQEMYETLKAEHCYCRDGLRQPRPR